MTCRRAPSSSARWIILVAQNEADLYEHLAGAFARDPHVWVVMDRRKHPRKTAGPASADLRTRGAVVIRRSTRKGGVDNEDSLDR